MNKLQTLQLIEAWYCLSHTHTLPEVFVACLFKHGTIIHGRICREEKRKYERDQEYIRSLRNIVLKTKNESDKPKSIHPRDGVDNADQITDSLRREIDSSIREIETFQPNPVRLGNLIMRVYTINGQEIDDPYEFTIDIREIESITITDYKS